MLRAASSTCSTCAGVIKLGVVTVGCAILAMLGLNLLDKHDPDPDVPIMTKPPPAVPLRPRDPNAKDPPAANPHTRRLAALAAQGVTLAICNRTTRAYSANAARQAGADSEAVRKEMTANAVIAGHFVPAGVIAVTRAQERGYANISIG